MASYSGRSPVEIIKEAVRARNKRLILDAVTPFYIFRTDNHQVLARGVMGYDAAREKTKQIRSQYGLNWDQVSFKAERSPKRTQPGYGKYAGTSPSASGVRTHYKDWDE